MDSEILCDSAGWVLFSDGQRLVFADLGTSYLRVLLFVLALISLITGVNGIVWLVAGMRSGQISMLGTALLAAAVFTGLGAWWTWTVEKRGRAVIPPRDAWVAVLDLEAQTLETPAGELLAPLSDVRFAPVMQLASSSRALAAEWPGGTRVVYRGNPFAGSIRPALDVLRRHGLAKD